MAYIIKMAKLGLEMEAGTVLKWYAEPGEEVAEGDMLAEVESEKSIGEIDAREDGVLRQIYVAEEESVPPGTPIGILAAPDADISDLKTEAEAELESNVPDAVSAKSETNNERAEPTATTTASNERTDENDESVTATTVDTQSDGQKASPRAKKRAEELGVNLASVDGTGFDGAITEEDVESAAEGTSATGAAETDVELTAEERLNSYRRTTAVADPSTGETLFETMEAVKTAFEERVTMTDVLVVVASAALTDHPLLNGTYAESTHQVQQTQNIALFADNDGELHESVIEDAERRSLAEVVSARQQIDEGDENGGARATFTLANAAEIDTEGRLVNPPAVAALTVDATGQRAVPVDDGVNLQSLVTTSLTYDTRAVGEDEARAFLDAFFERTKEASELVLSSYRKME
ncbi:2-oxo acid dehydrogenase subunit E2 [Halocatena marina]|uniref:2-oxo acid dehydrogenase subunit E2 n=1 Tax=Halocatena marina TaxID=2934937 RepID=A0ABD5YTP9_9EURY|nr:2-oxo acid dehydrogenase subunit E2 [Halocatena marina]